jgi:hypothetical protein
MSEEASDASNEASPTPPPAVARRRGETQKQTQQGILIWLCFFLFATHIIGGVFWLAIHYLGEK